MDPRGRWALALVVVRQKRPEEVHEAIGIDGELRHVTGYTKTGYFTRTILYGALTPLQAEP